MFFVVISRLMDTFMKIISTFPPTLHLEELKKGRFLVGKHSFTERKWHGHHSFTNQYFNVQDFMHGLWPVKNIQSQFLSV